MCTRTRTRVWTAPLGASGPRGLGVCVYSTLPYYIESWTFFHFFFSLFFSNCAENLESVCRGRMSSIAEANAAMPFISSGELFFRTRQDDPDSWLSSTLGDELRSFLGADAREDNEGDRNFEERRQMLDDAERLRARVPPLDVPRARDPHAFGGTAVPIFPVALKDD